MGSKKSFYHHISNKRINNENVHHLLNRSGDLLTVDADNRLHRQGLAVLCTYRVQGGEKLPVLEQD